MAYIMENSCNFGSQDGKPIVFTDNDRKEYLEYRTKVKKYFGLNPKFGGTVSFSGGRKFPPLPKLFEFTAPFTKRQMQPMMDVGAAAIITQRVIDIIERHEPDTHQYFPVKVHTKDGNILDYFILNVCVHLEALDVENSDAHRHEIVKERQAGFGGLKYSINTGGGGIIPQHNPPYHFYVFKDKIKSHAMWGEYGMPSSSRIFISDALYADLNAIGAFKGGVGAMFKVGEV